MSRPRLIVLKFGGSVLNDETDLSRAVHEIYRWRRDGWRVLAVVSAVNGQTDALLERCRLLCDDASPSSVAARVALGEIECAAELGLHLDRAGLPATVLTPGGMQLRAEGTPLDAEPVSIDRATVQAALHRDGVVIVPGFVAIDPFGRKVVLGRGGSDLTALFLADELGADRCRLIKDVDGLYESDPRCALNQPRRYVDATYADALATDGSIIQHKAVAYARRHNVPFELGAIHAVDVTGVGMDSTRFASTPELRPPLKVVLLGLGTVGGGVYDLLRQYPDLFQMTHVVVRDRHRPRTIDFDSSLLSTDVDAAVSAGADLMIELIGGVEIAHRAQRDALLNGSHVVSANKALLAKCGAELRSLSQQRDLQFRYSAAVAGSVPVLERLEGADEPPIVVRGILNGTTNFVLERLTAGESYADALRTAQQCGYAEADPTRDLNGLDAADKLCLIAHTLGASNVTPNDVDIEPLTESVIDRAKASAPGGRRLRHVAEFICTGSSPVLRLQLQECGPDDPLFDAPGTRNVVELRWADGRCELLRGRGAGRWPTAEAVLGDALAIVRSTSTCASPGQWRTACRHTPAVSLFTP